MRDDSYLNKRLNYIWQKYFADMPVKNKVCIHFGRSALYRFGSIRLCYSDNSTQITVNGKFRDEKYPSQIVDHTIAHELVHYSQGFSTPGPRLSRYPHRGGVIDKELKARGLQSLVSFYKLWVKDYIKNLR